MHICIQDTRQRCRNVQASTWKVVKVNEEKLMAYTVYVLTCKANGKKYVGMTSRRPEIRWNNGKGYSHQAIYPDILKYGWDSFDKEIIAKGLGEQEAALLERELIDKHDTISEKHGYNKSMGGEIIEGFHFTEERKKKLALSKMGERNPNYGKPGTMAGKKHSAEARKKIVEARKEQMRDPIIRERLKNGAAKARAKIEWTPEKRERQKAAARRALSKKCLCVTTGEMFRSATEAAKKIGTTVGCVARACRGERPTVLGLEFKYI